MARLKVVSVVFALGVLLCGCDWSQLGAWSSHNGDNFSETSITPSNVSSLTVHSTASAGTSGPLTPEAVVNGVLYAVDAKSIVAFSANHTAGCAGTPVACSPLWSYATTPVGNIAVSNGAVFVATNTGLQAFDAEGQTNCSGTPKVCAPLWQAVITTPGTPTVSSGIVYMVSQDGGGTLEAFDADGTTNCAGTPKVCTPLWSSTAFGYQGAADGVGVATVSGGRAYVVGGSPSSANGFIDTFDAAGSTGCSGTPKICSPLWQYVPDYPIYAEPGSVQATAVISGTTLFVTSYETESFRGLSFEAGGMDGFDANGVTGCSGSPKLCQPVWTSDGGNPSESLPAVSTNGMAFLSVAGTGIPGFLNSRIVAFDTNGPSDTEPWMIGDTGTPFVGGAVLYVESSRVGTVDAYDATGTAGCANLVCNSLWSSPSGFGTGLIANGILYVGGANASNKGEVLAYGLP